MDHSHMGHGEMGHGQPMCSMNMLFTWDTTNLCIIFRSWHVTGLWSLIGSLLAVVALTAGYEVVREASRRFEERAAQRADGIPPEAQNERRSLLWSGRGANTEEQKSKIVKAALYGIQVFYSFFIMLLFMTYNGWVMISVGVGAFIGFLIFGRGTVTKSAACH